MRLWQRITSAFSTRSYAAVSGGRRTRGHNTTPAPLTAMHTARGPLAARARYLASNNALAASGVEAWVSALVGTGIKPQSSHPDDAVRGALNLAWESWTDDADLDGATDAYGLLGLMVRRLVIDGESFALLVNTDAGFRIRVIDAEQVDGSLNRATASGRIVQGIEFDNAGRRVAYWIFPERPGMPFAVAMQAQRVPAEDVAHLYKVEFPGQVRGISWLAPVILSLGDLAQWSTAQIARQSTAAMLAGFITSSDGTGDPMDGERQGDTLIGGIEPGTIKYLAPGQSIDFSEPANIGSEVISFANITARTVAVGLGLPASILTGDLSDVNYSSIRAGLVEWRRRIEAIQHGVIAFQALRPIWRRWSATEVLSGRVETTVAAAAPAKFITPKQQWVDPSKDVEAELAAIAGGLMSRREAVTSRGVDVEALDAEIAADQARAKAFGLTFAMPKPANENQPPAAAA